MPNTSETGHAKNVANFESLLTFCAGYGSTYNPSRNELKVAVLQNLLTEARPLLRIVKPLKPYPTMPLMPGKLFLTI